MRDRYARWGLAIFCLGAGMALSLRRGPDASWDLQNYHLYAPYAALNGRLWRDYFAGDFEGYFNPLQTVPYFISRFVLFAGAPRIATALAGLPFGVLAILTIRLAEIVLAERAWWERLAAAALGLTGSTVYAEIGAPSGDVIGANLVLLGVLAVIRPDPGTRRVRWRAPAMAGLALGCAAGLKLTALIFAPGLLILAWRQAAGWRAAPVVAAAFAAGFLAGFAAVYGWWGYLLWRRFGDPFFPMLTGLFPTPWVPRGLMVHDIKFYPRSVMEFVFYPFYWLRGDMNVVTEESLRDPRFAIMFLASGLAAGVLWFRKSVVAPRVFVSLWWFFWVSYAVWLGGFCILRYALPLEAMSGVLIWSWLGTVLPRWPSRMVLGAILLFCLAFTSRYTLGGTPVAAALAWPVPALPAGSVVFLSGKPLGFMAYELRGPDEEFIGLDRIAGVAPEIGLIDHTLAAGRPAWLVTVRRLDRAGLGFVNGELAPVGLRVADGPCQVLHESMQWVPDPLEICELARS